MIVWTGRGLLIAVVAATCGVFAASFGPALEHLVLTPERHVSNAADMVLGCLGAAAGCMLLARWLEKGERRSERLLVDAATGETLRFARSDTLYGMKARTWSYILLAASAFGLVEFLWEAAGR